MVVADRSLTAAHCQLHIAYCILPFVFAISHLARPLATPIEPMSLPLPRNSPPRPAYLAASTPMQTNSHSVGALACYSVVEAIC